MALNAFEIVIICNLPSVEYFKEPLSTQVSPSNITIPANVIQYFDFLLRTHTNNRRKCRIQTDNMESRGAIIPCALFQAHLLFVIEYSTCYFPECII